MLYFVTATKKPLSFDKGFFVEWDCFTASRGGCAAQSAFLIPERAVGCSDKWVSLLRHGFAALNREITLANLLAVKTKKAPVFRQGLLRRIGVWRCATLTWGNPTLPSPLIRFTSEFGMGSGGAVSLWPPDKNFLCRIRFIFCVRRTCCALKSAACQPYFKNLTIREI